MPALHHQFAYTLELPRMLAGEDASCVTEACAAKEPCDDRFNGSCGVAFRPAGGESMEFRRGTGTVDDFRLRLLNDRPRGVLGKWLGKWLRMLLCIFVGRERSRLADCCRRLSLASIRSCKSMCSLVEHLLSTRPLVEAVAVLETSSAPASVFTSRSRTTASSHTLNDG
mmetsp:Transcript_12782/g.30456  ORF Transcript_12782/g.30456 Transcript_12782/m.30456 type:complete len:169 (-) Transcript_12782:537-1043(-)